jgi:predicted glycosyltransferase involved in capsule biosynthesis
MFEPLNPEQWIHKITSWAGLLVLSREAWEKVGGYDEAFIGWGYEDNAFQASLDRRVGHFDRVDGFVVHLWHPAPVEECFGQPHIKDNQARYEKYRRGRL